MSPNEAINADAFFGRFAHDPDFIEIPVKTGDEPRYLVMEKISGKQRPAVITYRGEKIRIISARRSRKEEVDIYEGS